MIFQQLANRLNKKLYRRAHRRLLKQWWDDGGDAQFRYDYPLDADSFVIDLGGYEGDWTGEIHAKYGCRIAVFEPVAHFAAAIAERFSDSEQIEVLQFGLGAVTETQTLYLRGAGSSTVRKRAEAEEIRLVDVKQWFEDNQVSSVALMKINIEGGEYDLLDRMLETGLAASVQNFQIQFHNFTVDASRRMESIQARLSETHELSYQYRFVWENWVRKSNA
jgi:FkbM family methyltransferase